VAVRSLDELVARALGRGVPISHLVVEEEAEESGESPDAVRQRMAGMLSVMAQSVAEGLTGNARAASGLVGGDAAKVERARTQGRLPADLLAAAVARAMAVSEVNASMGRIVAAPTAGAAGVLPGVLLALRDVAGIADDRLVEAMFTAAGIGQVVAARASLSGAEGGCQAESGSAAAMAAGAATQALGGGPAEVGQAVAFCLQNMLGLICDPIAGLVEVPCLGRNAAGAGQALVAAALALSGVVHPIPPDEIIDTMGRVGRSLPEAFRETAWGGLAVTPTGRSIAERLGLVTEPPGGGPPRPSGASA
jgi:L-serine dehydratase